FFILQKKKRKTGQSLSSPERPSVFDTKRFCLSFRDVEDLLAQTVVEPNSMADNIRWKSISVVTAQVGFHLLSLLGSSQLDNTMNCIPTFRAMADLLRPLTLRAATSSRWHGGVGVDNKVSRSSGERLSTSLAPIATTNSRLRLIEAPANDD